MASAPRHKPAQTRARAKKPSAAAKKRAAKKAAEAKAAEAELTARKAARAIAQAKFLDAFREHGIVVRAARAAGVGRHTVYDWRAQDPVFEAAFTEAVEDVMDEVEAEARRRAVQGWDEEVYQLGAFVGTVRKYDSQLLQLLLRCRRPDVFREKTQVEATVDAKVRHGHQIIDPTTSSTAELEARVREALAQIEALRRYEASDALPRGTVEVLPALPARSE